MIKRSFFFPPAALYRSYISLLVWSIAFLVGLLVYQNVLWVLSFLFSFTSLLRYILSCIIYLIFNLYTQPIDKEQLALLTPVAFCHALGHVMSNVSFAAVAVSFTHTIKGIPFAKKSCIKRVYWFCTSMLLIIYI